MKKQKLTGMLLLILLLILAGCPLPSGVQHTVSFDSKGGSDVTSQKVAEGGHATEPTAPIKSGYDFKGWYSDSELTTAWNFATDKVDAAQTLYAKWEVQQQTTTYTVSFDSKGGNPVSSQRVNPGGYATEPTAPTRSGYDFKGWYSDSELTTAWNFTSDKVDATQTLYAKWEVQQQTTTYTVSFDSKGGNPVSSQRVNPGGYATEPTVPTRSGYDFKGWYSDSGLRNAWNFASDTVDAAQTLYAKWEVQQQTTPYTVSFDSKGGNPVSSQRVNPGGYATEPTAPTRSGYVFKGWYADSGLRNAWNFATDTVTAAQTLYAKWEANKYTLSFDSTGGSSVSHQTVDKGGHAAEPTVPTRTGYIFKGWYSDSGLRNAWNFATDTVDAAQTLYAKWEVQQYTVSFNSKGGNPVSSQRVNHGGYATEPTAPTRTGYIIKGWYADYGLRNAWNFATDTVDESLTLYAGWISVHSIRFESNGGSAVSSQRVKHGGYATKPEDPTKTGLAFGGWYADSELSAAWDFAKDTVTKSRTLYAKWGFLLSFNSTGGSPVPIQTVLPGKYATEPPAPTKSGYGFKGWYSDPELKYAWNFTLYAVNRALTLYAKWGVQHTITFESKGGSPVPSQAVDDGKYATKPPAPTRSGYVFKGWYSDSGLSTTWNFGTAMTQSQTLYAKWIAEYSISFESNGGSAVSSQRVLDGGYVTEPPDPRKSGYVFWGWYSESGLSKTWNFTSDKVTQSQTLYAKWGFRLSFDSNGGSFVPSQIVAEGETAIEPPAQTRSGYTFKGWYSDSGLSYAWNFALFGVNRALTLYAKWELNRYTVSFESNGGSAVSSERVTEGRYVRYPPDPRKGRYVLWGWYSDSGFTTKWNFYRDVVTQDLTLYAKWGFRISFDSNGGSFVPDQMVAEGKTATEPPAQTRSGYVLKGWYSDSGLTKTWDFATAMTQSQTLYAKWLVAYSISFDSNHGSFVPSQIVGEGETATEPPAPTMRGYVFKGWYSDSGLHYRYAWNFATDTVEESLTLYAKWQVNWYTVSFESNGGSAVPSQMVAFARYVTEPPAPTRDGYVFKGWYSGSELSFAWDFATRVVWGPRTLYAKWVPESQKTYSIGDTGPAGGKVFYDNGNYSDGWRYLEVAPSDQTDGSYEWGGYGTSVETSASRGTGEANTRAIVAELGRDTVYAARICDELKFGGYDDWFLPSLRELDELSKQREALGGFPSNNEYWSSSERDSKQAFSRHLDISGSYWYRRSKSLKREVLAVRSF